MIRLKKEVGKNKQNNYFLSEVKIKSLISCYQKLLVNPYTINEAESSITRNESAKN